MGGAGRPTGSPRSGESGVGDLVCGDCGRGNCSCNVAFTEDGLEYGIIGNAREHWCMRWRKSWFLSSAHSHKKIIRFCRCMYRLIFYLIIYKTSSEIKCRNPRKKPLQGRMLKVDLTISSPIEKYKHVGPFIIQPLNIKLPEIQHEYRTSHQGFKIFTHLGSLLRSWEQGVRASES